MCYCTCSDVMCASHSTCTQASQPPYIYMACQKLLMGMLFMPAKLYLSKLTASHFGTLNMKIANQNMLKRILIVMHNENKANCNENFRICAEEPIGPLYKLYASIGCGDGVITITSLVLVHFGLIKLKPKQNTSVFPTHFSC